MAWLPAEADPGPIHRESRRAKPVRLHRRLTMSTVARATPPRVRKGQKERAEPAKAWPKPRPTDSRDSQGGPVHSPAATARIRAPAFQRTVPAKRRPQGPQRPDPERRGPEQQGPEQQGRGPIAERACSCQTRAHSPRVERRAAPKERPFSASALREANQPTRAALFLSAQRPDSPEAGWASARQEAAQQAARFPSSGLAGAGPQGAGSAGIGPQGTGSQGTGLQGTGTGDARSERPISGIGPEWNRPRRNRRARFAGFRFDWRRFTRGDVARKRRNTGRECEWHQFGFASDRNTGAGNAGVRSGGHGKWRTPSRSEFPPSIISRPGSGDSTGSGPGSEGEMVGHPTPGDGNQGLGRNCRPAADQSGLGSGTGIFPIRLGILRLVRLKRRRRRGRFEQSGFKRRRLRPGFARDGGRRESVAGWRIAPVAEAAASPPQDSRMRARRVALHRSGWPSAPGGNAGKADTGNAASPQAARRWTECRAFSVECRG